MMMCLFNENRTMTMTLHKYLLSLFLLAPLLLFAGGGQYEEKTIDRLDVVIINAPTHLSSKANEVKGRIRSKVGDFFSQEIFDDDLKVLSQEFLSVSPKLEVHGDRLSISIEVSLRPMIRSIQFCGNKAFSPSKLRTELDITPQTILDRVALTRAVRKLKVFYVKKGFFEVDMDWDIEQDECTNEVDISITICEGRSGKIEHINFCGFEPCEQKEILECMLTKEWSIWTFWLNDDGIYSPDMIEHDRFTILSYLQNRGYADADVKIDVCESKSSNRICLRITADKGDLYTFGPITFENNTLFTDEQIRAQFSVCEGSPYSSEKLRETVLNVLGLYGRCGYINTLANYEPSLDPECPVYSVHMEIEEGEQYHVGLINVSGNCSTKNKVILHETLLIPGEVFNLDKLKNTEERLSRIGYFSTVNVYASPSEGLCGLGENYRDVYIEVEETGTGNFSLFGGFSNQENFFAGIQVTEKNFSYQGLTSIWSDGLCSLRGGGEYAYLRVSLGEKSQNYILSWTKPYFWDTQWVVGFDIDKSKISYVSSDYNIDSHGVVLHAKYPINIYTRAGVHYRIRNANIEVKNSVQQSAQLLAEAGNAGLISAIGASLNYDDTDNPQRATKGFRSKLEGEFAGIGGDSTFFSVGYLNSWYYPITCDGDDVFKIRADVRFIQPVGSTNFANLPLDERLFLGGDSTVRGYRPYALGPKFVGTTIPRGGLSLNLFSAEATHRFSDRWEVFGYIDSGHLSTKRWRIGDFRTAAGIGARVCVLPGMPPLTVGLGWPIGEKNRADVQHFFFTLGASF